jgi:hypothetical protein
MQEPATLEAQAPKMYLSYTVLQPVRKLSALECWELKLNRAKEWLGARYLCSQPSPRLTTFDGTRTVRR